MNFRPIMSMTATAGLATALATSLATQANADIFTNAVGLGIEPVITFEDRGSGVVDGTEWQAETGIVFDTPLLYITDFFTNPGGENNLLAGDMGLTSLNITFDDPQTSFAMAWATNPGSSTVTAFLDGEVVETVTLPTSFLDPDNAFLVVENITFDRIQIKINARIFDFSLDNVQASASDRVRSCPGDLADDFGFTANQGGGPDGQVEFGDFIALLGLIGPCDGGTPGCLGDIADDFGFLINEGGGPDGVVDFGDFVALLGHAGPCP